MGDDTTDADDADRSGVGGPVEYPADIDETARGHPEDDMDIIDEPDPEAGEEPYPDDAEARGMLAPDDASDEGREEIAEELAERVRDRRDQYDEEN